MSIQSNIEEIMGQVAGGDTQLGDEIQQQAVAAIMAGHGSQEWQDYMARFSQSPAELARLLATDNTANQFEMDLARTTLVANGTCGATTTGFHLSDGVDDKLDENLP
jgi:hypothetical protein